MAKELPYFKFEPSQWENGTIQLCTFEQQGVFIAVCSMYWQRVGDLPYKLAVQKICRGNAVALDSLYDQGIFTIVDGMICIDFLNEQLAEFNNLSAVNAENARLGWEKRRNKATAKRPQSEPNAIREEKIRGKKIREDEIGADKSATLEDRKLIFRDKVANYLPEYSKEMCRAFFDYWSESNEGGSKMLFETKKTFNIGLRLSTWKRNEKTFTHGKSKPTITAQATLDRLNSYTND